LPPGILKVIKFLGHLLKVMGQEPVFFLYHLFVKRVKGEPVKAEPVKAE